MGLLPAVGSSSFWYFDDHGSGKHRVLAAYELQDALETLRTVLNLSNFFFIYIIVNLPLLT